MGGTITYKYQENLRLSIFIKATVSRGASRRIASHAAGASGPVFPVLYRSTAVRVLQSTTYEKL